MVLDNITLKNIFAFQHNKNINLKKLGDLLDEYHLLIIFRTLDFNVPASFFKLPSDEKIDLLLRAKTWNL
jgi:hypothetical protein